MMQSYHAVVEQLAKLLVIQQSLAQPTTMIQQLTAITQQLTAQINQRFDQTTAQTQQLITQTNQRMDQRFNKLDNKIDTLAIRVIAK